MAHFLARVFSDMDYVYKILSGLILVMGLLTLNLALITVGIALTVIYFRR